MAAISRTKLSLRIAGENLDPIEISRRLGAEADQCWRRGDPWEIRGHPVKPRPAGFWCVKSRAPQSADLDAHVRDIFGRLSEDTDAWDWIAETFDADLFCGLFLDTVNEGLVLSGEVITMIAARRLRLGLDIYGTV